VELLFDRQWHSNTALLNTNHAGFLRLHRAFLHSIASGWWLEQASNKVQSSQANKAATKPLKPAPRRTDMTTTFNTRSALTRITEIATVSLMVGMSLLPVAMAHNPASAEEANITRLPTVVVTAAGAQEVTQFETVYVTGKRAL
jgi:hypothetical protein